MQDLFDDADGQSDTGSDLFATAIICIILLITILITQTGGSRGKVQLPDIDANWLLIFSTALQGAEDKSDLVLNQTGKLAVGDKPRSGSSFPKGKLKDVEPLRLKSGELLEVTLDARKFDPYLLLSNPQGQIVARDDDSGAGLNSHLTYLPTEDGTHNLVVTSYRDGETGQYDLSARVTRSANNGAQWDVSNSEVTRFDNESVVRLSGSDTRLIPMDQFVAEKLEQVLGPLGVLNVDRASGLGSAERHCLRLTFDSAILEPCDG